MKTKLKDTRKAILFAVYEDMKVNGYTGCRPDKIVQSLGITKGALYHYFPNKILLGYAIVEEVLEPKYLQFWQPLQDFDGNPIDFLISRIRQIQKFFDQKEVLVGSPLSNLIQEMSPLDDGFRTKLENIVNAIREIIIEAIKKAQYKGIVSISLDGYQLTNFYIATLEGSYNLAKVANDKTVFVETLDCLIDYLKSINHE